MKLLIIENDPAIQHLLKQSFERQGAQIAICGDGNLALNRWRAYLPDVVLLELNLPGQDGLEVLSRARAEGLQTPVLILSTRTAVGDRILGLNTGADDYLLKPFDPDELAARVHALARRAQAQGKEPDSTHWPEFCGMQCDRRNRAIYFRGSLMELAPRENTLLRALLEQPGHVVAKERLFDLVFSGETEVHYEAIEVVAYRLRKKLAQTGAQLVTLRGLGYLLKADV